MGKFIAVSYLIFAILSILLLIRLKLLYDMSVIDFFKKCSNFFVIAFTTVSGNAMMMANFDVCKKNLKIEPALVDFWVPLSHSMFSPTTPISFVMCVFVGAEVSGATLSITQLLIAAFLAFQFSLITPKVSGGPIAIFTLILSNLVLSTDAISLLVPIEFATCNIRYLVGGIIRDCEIYDLSHKIKISD